MNYVDHCNSTSQDDLAFMKKELTSLSDTAGQLRKFVVRFIEIPVISKDKYYPVLDDDISKTIHIYIVNQASAKYLSSEYRWINNPTYHVVVENLKLRSELLRRIIDIKKILPITNSSGITDYQIPESLTSRLTLCTNGLTLTQYVMENVLKIKPEVKTTTNITNLKNTANPYDTQTCINFIKKKIHDALDGNIKDTKTLIVYEDDEDADLVKLINIYNKLVFE